MWSTCRFGKSFSPERGSPNEVVSSRDDPGVGKCRIAAHPAHARLHLAAFQVRAVRPIR